MSATLTINGKEYITAVLAGKKFGYTKDYFLMLAKQGKIDGQKVGNRWYINPISAEDFFTHSKKKKEERSQRVSEERKLELKKHTKVRKKENGYKRAAVVETLVILIIGLSLGATGYIGTSSNIATAQVTEYGFFENIALSVYSFFSPDSNTLATSQKPKAIPVSTIENTEVSANIGTTTHTSLVIAPNEVFTATTVESVRSSFSDEVEISIDPNNPDTGVIVPIFKERKGEEYRFLIVPVNQSNN